MAYSKKKHLQDNILAIQTVFRLKNENREVTADEKEILGRYSGFGGLKCILRPCECPEDKNKWPASEQGLFEDTKLLYSIIRQHCVSDVVYKDYCNSLRSSILTAFYTPDQVTQAIAGGLYDSGIEAKSILEPSAGIGSFVKAFDDLGNYSVTCFEKDLQTAEILSRLYPHNLVLGKGFETIDERSLNYFDVVSSNIPFGDYRVHDPLFSGSKDEDKKRSCKDIHSYFFIKAVDAAREGGIIAFITSQGVMNSPKNDYLRKWLMDRCNLVSAIRLPDNLFIDSANTEAPSDLIILQKNSSKTEQTIREYSFTGIRKLGEVNINNYYIDFSRVVHTAVSLGKNQYGYPAINFLYEGSMDELSADLYNKIREDCVIHLDLELYNTYLKTEILPDKRDDTIRNNEVQEELTLTKEFSLYDLFGIPEEERTQIVQKQKTKAGAQSLQKTSVCLSLTDITDNAVEIRTQSLEPRLYEGILMDFYKDGVLVENEGQVGILSIKNKWNQKKQCEDKEYLFTPLKINKDLTSRLVTYINLREAYFHLHQTETIERRERSELRETLNNRYLEFTTKYGDLNNKDNHKLLQQDIFGDEILTLEYYESGKKQMAGIFFHPVAFMTDKTILVEKADEALASSINKFGVVNLDYMSGISGKDNNVLIEELEGIIYYNPLSGEYEIASCFISGDVIVKSEEIEAYINDNPEADDLEQSQKSLEVLKKAIPQPIPFSDLDFNFGERWLPVTYYNEYVSRIFNTKIIIEYIADIDNFHIAAESEYTVEIREKYAVKPEYSNDVSGLTILSHALVNTFPKITKPSGRYNASGQEIRIPDLDAIQQANTKIDEIRSGFTDYLNDLPIEAKGELANLYNRKFNARVKPKYDGKFQTFPDLQLQALGIDKPYDSQFDTVWMLKSNGGGIVDHEVGAGKTLTICITAHEMKRLKMAHKPMIIGLKTNIFTIAETYMKAYPNDKVLYPSEKDFEPKNRKSLFHKIKNNDCCTKPTVVSYTYI